ncbi:hypothetical protein NBRC111894_3868 [Sporolactobacillus inulinus]|uniref:Uncharacterized protein n=1 Tax=Sporolactobacillus inulinus TaxID=2078 RepID=A0A4Y1ZHD6_9BACL|nr:hypothetical protein NBRC111894_3868 [Sporolactobacillus inulinus]
MFVCGKQSCILTFLEWINYFKMHKDIMYLYLSFLKNKVVN